MEDIRIYDYEFNLLGIESKVISANWILRFNGIGSFEAHFSPRSDIAALAADRPYLIAVQGGKQAVVTAKQLGAAGNHAGDFVLYGRTINWMLSRRIAQAFDMETMGMDGHLSTVVRYIAEQAFADVSNYVVEPMPGGWEADKVVWRRGTHTASEVLAECLAIAKSGHMMEYDIENRLWRFRAMEPRRTGLIVSEADKNAYDTQLSEDVQNLATSGFYDRETEDRGGWNAQTNKPLLVNNVPQNYCKYYDVTTAGTQFGISFAVGDRIVCRSTDGKWQKNADVGPVWSYISPKNGESGMYKWDTMLGGETLDDAEASLASHAFEQNIAVKTRGLKYERDYMPGDIVTLQYNVGGGIKSMEKQITGVRIWYEQGNVGERPYFN